MELDQLIYTYGDYLFRISYSYVKDEQAAEEIVQDVFLKFYKTTIQFENDAHIKTYITRMVINKSYDYLRSWKFKKNIMLEKFHLTRPGVDKQIVEKAESSIIWSALLKLPIKQREAIILYYFEDLSIKEIAAMLYTAESTIKSRLQRGRIELKTLLDENEWEVLNHE